MTGSLTQRTLGNLALSATARVVSLGVQLLANVVLARQLSPADYGIVGYAQIFISFLSLVSEFGLSSAAIQQPRLSSPALHTGFTLRMMLGLCAFGLALAVAPWCAQGLGDAAVADVVRLLAVGFLINGLAFMPSVLALRALDYPRYSAAQVVGSLVNGAVTVWLAWHGWGYLSIVLANVVAIAAQALLLNLLIRQPLRLALEPESARHYARFGGQLFVASVLTFIIMNLDNLVIGTLLGPVTLGYYALAFGWGVKVCELLGSVVNSVLFPTFAKIQSDVPRLRAAYVKSMELVAFAAVAGYLTLLACSADFVRLILGGDSDKWLPALGPLRILIVYGLIRALLEPVGSVVMAIGGVAVLVRANFWAAVVKVALVYPALLWAGIEGVALVVTLSYATQYLVFLPALAQHLGLSPRGFAAPLWRPLLAAMASYAALAALRLAGWVPPGLAGFGFTVVFCLVAYLAAFGVLTRGAAYRELLALLRERAAARRRPGNSG